MIILNVKNNICYLQSDRDDFLFRSLLNNNLTVFEKVRVFSRGRKSKQYKFDNKPVPLYTIIDRLNNLYHFPRGLFTLLGRQLDLYNNDDLKVIDDSTDYYRVTNEEIKSTDIANILRPNAPFSLRQDQILAVMKALYHKRGIVQLPTGCFTGDTKIRLLNGTVKSFEELVNEGINDFDVISMTSDGEVVPGKAHNPHITKYVDKLVEITLDDDSKIRCTPEHKFMLRDGTYERAENLAEGTSLMPHYSSIGKTNKDGTHGTPMSEYIWTYVPKYNEYQQLHRIISDKINGHPEGTNVHHKDGNKLNNSTDNLKLLSVSEHCRIHALEYHRNHPDHAVNTLGKYIKEHPEHQLVAARAPRSAEAIKKNHDRLVRYNSESHPRLRKDITIESVIEALESSYDIYEAADKLKCSRTVIYSRLGKAGLNYKDYLKKRNHKVKSVNVIELSEKIPVYDIEVDEYHNFAIETSDMSGVIVHNSGKSEVMAAIITILESKFPDIKITVIEPTDVLVNKTTERFNKYDLNAVRYKDIRKLDNPNFNVLVAHPTSLLNDSDKDPALLDNMAGVFWDECQHCRCETWKTLNERLRNCEYALGFSALAVSDKHIYETNIRVLDPDEVLIEGATGPVIVNISPKYYIENDILATPVILQLTNQLGRGLYGCNDWSKLRQQGIESEGRTKLTAEVVDMFSYYDRRVLILVGTKKQAYDIASQLALEYNLSDKIAISFGAGESLLVNPDGTRYPYDGEDIVSDFDNERFSILISTSHMDEGVDLSNLDVAVLASGGKKDRRVVQRIGRALRNNKSGKYAYIVDFFDKGSGVLENHSNLRMRLYKNTIQVPKDLIFQKVSTVKSFIPYFEALEGMVDTTPSVKLMDAYNRIAGKSATSTQSQVRNV